MERQGSTTSQNVTKSIEASTTDGQTGENPNGGMLGSNLMMNGMGQMGFFPNQGGFNNGMAWNGMNQMNGMPNMMANGSFNPMGTSFCSSQFRTMQLTCHKTST
jgi:hypothetical protein